MPFHRRASEHQQEAGEEESEGGVAMGERRGGGRIRLMELKV